MSIFTKVLSKVVTSVTEEEVKDVFHSVLTRLDEAGSEEIDLKWKKHVRIALIAVLEELQEKDVIDNDAFIDLTGKINKW